jgi:hypothetical protein
MVCVIEAVGGLTWIFGQTAVDSAVLDQLQIQGRCPFRENILFGTFSPKKQV